MDRPTTLSHAARIWNFDGGGPSVISQLIIVNEIMYRIQLILKLPTVPRPCDYAELMVGTGLGAVAVVLMARLCLTAEEALADIIDLGKTVFAPANEDPDLPLFSANKLKSGVTAVLKRHGLSPSTKMIEDTLVEGQACAVILTTSAANLSTCRALRTYSVGHSDPNPTIVEAIMATMATPRWFEPVAIGPPYAREMLIGGAMGFNNPTSEGLEEAKRIFGPEQPVALVVSFGSGQTDSPRLESSTMEGLAAALERTTMDSEKTAEEMSRRMASTSIYYRFSVDKGLNNSEITEWDDIGLSTINSCTKDYNVRNSSSLDAVVDLLLKKRGLVTMDQITQAAAKTATTIAKRVPTLTPYYVPREDVYQAMRHSLSEDFEGLRLFVLCGMAGVGKTQSSSYYEKINYKKYSHIFFIDASSATNIEVDLQSAVRSLGSTHSQDTYEDALRFLSHPDSGNWLVIMDNADDPNLPLRKYLPHSREGSMIITTRNTGLVQLAPSSYWRLVGMEEKEAMSVLFRSAHLARPAMEDDEKYGREIYEALGGLPLALVQAGVYCFSSGISFRQYLERLKQYRSELMNTRLNSQVDEYNYSAYASIRLSYSLLDAQAEALLKLLAFFHPSTIHLDIFRTAAKYNFIGDPETECLPWDDLRPERLDKLRQLLTPNGEWNEIYVDKLLHQLQSFSLVSLSSSTGSTIITIHPLIQSCVQDAFSAAEYSFNFHMAVHTLNSCIQDETPPIFQHLTAHIAEVESRGVQIHVNDDISFAHVLGYNGKFEDSMKKWDRVKEECGRMHGHDHRSTLRPSFWRANCMYRLGRYEEAEEILRLVLISQEREFGKGHEYTIHSHELLGRVLTMQGKTREAEVVLKQVLELYEDKHGSEHSRTLRTRMALADNLLTQSSHSQAEAILRNAIPVMTSVLGVNHEFTMHASNTLSLALLRQGKSQEAEAILDGLVTLSNTRYGKEHPNTLQFLFNLSLCLQDRKDWTGAERIQREVLETREKILGKKHPSIMQARKALNETLQAMQEPSPVDNAQGGPVLESPFDPQSTNSSLPKPSQLDICLKYLETIWRFVVSTSFILLKYHFFEESLLAYLLTYFFFA